MSGPGVTRAYLGLGSNLGDRFEALRQAIRELADTPGITVRDISSCYETAPVGPVGQGDFLNAAVSIDTALSPEELLDACKAIETRMGRQARERWGPREIDIDLWGGQPHAVGGSHGGEHVSYELMQVFTELRNRPGRVSHHRLSPTSHA